MTNRAFRSIAIVLLATAGLACAAAAIGGAGAATGIYLTSRGASGVVDGGLRDVTRRTETVMRDLGITVTERKIEYDDNEVEFEGETDDLDISIDLEAQSPTTTRVDVEARKSLVEWDQDYAKAVVERIVQAR